MDASQDPRMMAHRQGDLFGQGRRPAQQGSQPERPPETTPVPHRMRDPQPSGPGTQFPEVFGEFGSAARAAAGAREGQKIELRSVHDVLNLLARGGSLVRAEIEGVVALANDAAHWKELSSPLQEMEKVIIAPQGTAYSAEAKWREARLKELDGGKDGFKKGPEIPPDQLSGVRQVGDLAGLVSVFRSIGIPAVATVVVSPRSPVDVAWQLYYRPIAD